MTLPNSHRTCHQCDYVGDVAEFWVKDSSGEYIKSVYHTVPLDKLRLGSEAASKFSYRPNKEVCPKCGYDRESFENRSKSTDVTLAHYARMDARRKAALEKARGSGCLLLLFTITATVSAWLII
jgi:hypothetical protein